MGTLFWKGKECNGGTCSPDLPLVGKFHFCLYYLQRLELATAAQGSTLSKRNAYESDIPEPPPSRWNDVDTLTALMSPKREKGRMF